MTWILVTVLLLAGCSNSKKEQAIITLAKFEQFAKVNGFTETPYQVSNREENSYFYTFQFTQLGEAKYISLIQWCCPPGFGGIMKREFEVHFFYEGNFDFNNAVVVCHSEGELCRWQEHEILTRSECKSKDLNKKILKGSKLKDFWEEFADHLNAIMRSHKNATFVFYKLEPIPRQNFKILDPDIQGIFIPSGR